MYGRLFLCCSLLISLVAACAAPSADVPESEVLTDPSEIQGIHNDLVAAINGTDPLAVANFYSPEAVRILSDGSTVEGIESMRQNFETFVGIDDWAIDVESPVVFASGALAVTVADYVESGITSEDGDPQPNEVGYWLFVWQREPDGSWKVVREIWSDRPEA